MSLHSTLRNQAINLPAADAPKKRPAVYLPIRRCGSVSPRWLRWWLYGGQSRRYSLSARYFYLLHSRSCISYGPLPARKVYGCHAMAASGC